MGEAITTIIDLFVDPVAVGGMRQCLVERVFDVDGESAVMHHLDANPRT